MPASASSNTGRLVGRLSATFLHQTIRNARAGAGSVDDQLDLFILVATLQANIGMVLNDPSLHASHATAGSLVPDEMRRARAVSVHAVAISLGLPYETVRRRVAKLVELDSLGATDAGVWVRETVFIQPAQIQANLDNYALVRRHYRRLRELDVLTPPRRTVPFTEGPPVLAVVRILIDYVLRSVQAMRRGDADIIDVVVLLGVMRANVEHLPDRPRPGASGRPRPVSALALSAQLGLPRETIRRRLARLVETGDCLRTEEGFVAGPKGGAAFLGTPQNLANLRRMFALLDELGVLARWEIEGLD